jgi:hypothetical protein
MQHPTQHEADNNVVNDRWTGRRYRAKLTLGQVQIIRLVPGSEDGSRAKAVLEVPVRQRTYPVTCTALKLGLGVNDQCCEFAA